MTPTPLLDRYREAGYTISRDADGLCVESEHAMPENTRARLVKRKPALLRELAYEAAGLEEWRAPLALGHMVVCANCVAFQFAADPAGLGHCRRYDTEAAPFVAFACEDFLPSATPAAPGFLPTPMVGEEATWAAKEETPNGKVPMDAGPGRRWRDDRGAARRLTP